MLFDSHYLVICDRKHFENFDPSSIAQFTEKKLITPKINGNPLLSEPKLRAIVENAKQLLKVTSKLMLCFKNMIKFLYELRFEERKKKVFKKKILGRSTLSASQNHMAIHLSFYRSSRSLVHSAITAGDLLTTNQ